MDQFSAYGGSRVPPEILDGAACINLDAQGWQTITATQGAIERYNKWLERVAVHCAKCDSVILTPNGPVLQDQLRALMRPEVPEPVYCGECRLLEDG